MLPRSDLEAIDRPTVFYTTCIQYILYIYIYIYMVSAQQTNLLAEIASQNDVILAQQSIMPM